MAISCNIFRMYEEVGSSLSWRSNCVITALRCLQLPLSTPTGHVQVLSAVLTWNSLSEAAPAMVYCASPTCVEKRHVWKWHS